MALVEQWGRGYLSCVRSPGKARPSPDELRRREGKEFNKWPHSSGDPLEYSDCNEGGCVGRDTFRCSNACCALPTRAAQKDFQCKHYVSLSLTNFLRVIRSVIFSKLWRIYGALYKNKTMIYCHKNERNERKRNEKASEPHLGGVCADFGLEAGNQDAIHTHAVELCIRHLPEVRNLQETRGGGIVKEMTGNGELDTGCVSSFRRTLYCLTCWQYDARRMTCGCANARRDMTVMTPSCRKALSKPWKERSASQICKPNDSFRISSNSLSPGLSVRARLGGACGRYM